MNSIFPTLPTTDTESKEYQKIKRTYSKDRLLSEIYSLQREVSNLSAQLSSSRTHCDRFRELAAQRASEAQLSDWSDVIKRFRQLTAESLKQQSRAAAAELRTIWS